MKRFLMIMLAVALVMSAATAFAEVKAANSDINLSGSLTFRGWYANNLDNDSSTVAGDTAFYDTQFRLLMEAKVDKAKAVVEFQNSSGGSDKWGTTSTGPGSTDFQSGDNADLHFRQAYIAFPVMGLHVSVGHQLLSLGVKSFFDASKDGAAGILVTYPFDKNVVGVGTIKHTENNGLTSDAWSGPNSNDLDIHFGLASFALGGGHTLGINIGNVVNANTTTNDNASLWNYGLTLSGKLDPVTYTIAGDMQGGKADGINKNQGYHMRGVLGYQATPEMGLNLASIYYSGEKTGADVKKFATYLEDTNYATFVFGYLNRGLGGTYGTGTPAPGGFWYNKVGATYKPTKDLALGLDYINIRGTYGAGQGPSSVTSKDVGDEVDVTLAYNISKGLTYNIIGGILMPGKAYKQANALRDDNAIAARHSITLSF